MLSTRIKNSLFLILPSLLFSTFTKSEKQEERESCCGLIRIEMRIESNRRYTRWSMLLNEKKKQIIENRDFFSHIAIGTIVVHNKEAYFTSVRYHRVVKRSDGKDKMKSNSINDRRWLWQHGSITHNVFFKLRRILSPWR